MKNGIGSCLFLLLIGSLRAADDCSTLFSAVEMGDYFIVHEYCIVGYDYANRFPPAGMLFVDGSNADGNTAIALAAMYGHYDIAKRLIAAGAYVNIVNNKRETPLMHAA